MKIFLFLSLVAVILFSCNKEDIKPKFYLAPNAVVKIKPAVNTLKALSTEHLSAKEIVKQSVMISFYNIPVYGNQAVDVGFSETQRDTVSNPPCLLRWATDLINVDGSGNYYLVPDLISASDVVFCRAVNNHRDTIAYTPNSVMKQMETDIKAALAAQDTILAYKVFNDNFTFTPITGAEWRTLKANGTN